MIGNRLGLGLGLGLGIGNKYVAFGRVSVELINILKCSCVFFSLHHYPIIIN